MSLLAFPALALNVYRSFEVHREGFLIDLQQDLAGT